MNESSNNRKAVIQARQARDRNSKYYYLIQVKQMQLFILYMRNVSDVVLNRDLLRDLIIRSKCMKCMCRITNRSR
jgi:hypothetical protein